MRYPTSRAHVHALGLAGKHPVYAGWPKETPPDATVLVDQFTSSGTFGQAIHPQKVRQVGRRADVASLDFPFLDKDMQPSEACWETVFANRTVDRINQAWAQCLFIVSLPPSV